VSEVTIRGVTADDAPALAAIYGHHVLHGLGTFEYEAPTAETMAQRLAGVVERGLPYLVAEGDGRVLGYAYASVFRPRLGYRFTVEDSVYIAPDAAGRGLGKALLARVIADCEALGLRQMIACIGDRGNAASIALHRSLGFEDQGVVQSAGWKHGRWVDIVFMRRALGAGDGEAPTAEGLRLDS
jgi:L-amino acid N-acyltransferase YncA